MGKKSPRFPQSLCEHATFLGCPISKESFWLEWAKILFCFSAAPVLHGMAFSDLQDLLEM